ncbi:MAG: hypothetical protein J6W75_12155 [Bacteroidaceae bacterium]|nr:hypothetical protein [Bacteroidaceae bacterium]
MNEREILEMQQKIDQGILLAQRRLVERARLFRSTLVVARDGKVVELMPEELSAPSGAPAHSYSQP